MRRCELAQGEMFSCVTLEQRAPADHPLREIRRLTDALLVSLDASFDALYAASGCRSIAPEYVLRALLLQAFYSVRSDGSWSSSWTITCCFAGLLASAWTTPCGTTRCFPRTAIVC